MKKMKLEIPKSKTKRMIQLTDYSKVVERKTNSECTEQKRKSVIKSESSCISKSRKKILLNSFVIKNDVGISNGFPVLHSDNKNAFRNSFLVSESTPQKVKGNKKGNGICEWFKKHRTNQHKQNANQPMVMFSFTKHAQSDYIDNSINNISINIEPLFKYSSNYKTPKFKEM